jgi:hypothetical protein
MIGDFIRGWIPTINLLPIDNDSMLNYLPIDITDWWKDTFDWSKRCPIPAVRLCVPRYTKRTHHHGNKRPVLSISWQEACKSNSSYSELMYNQMVYRLQASWFLFYTKRMECQINSNNFKKISFIIRRNIMSNYLKFLSRMEVVLASIIVFMNWINAESLRTI